MVVGDRLRDLLAMLPGAAIPFEGVLLLALALLFFLFEEIGVTNSVEKLRIVLNYLRISINVKSWYYFILVKHFHYLPSLLSLSVPQSSPSSSSVTAMGATRFKLPSKFWVLVARDEGTLGDVFPLFNFGDPGDKQLKFELSLNI